MTSDAIAKDCWIAGQLAGIRLLERELSDALNTRSARVSEDLRRRLDELNSWLNQVDDALTARARSPQQPRRVDSRLPFFGSSNRLPAA